MAVEKGKVKAALDVKFKGTSVTKELKEQLAELYAGLIEDEGGIEEFINTREPEIKIHQKEADRRSQAAATKARQDAADAAAGKTKEEQATEEVEDPTEPAWAKALRKQNEALQAQLNGFQQQQQTKTIESQFKSDARIKGVPESFLKGRIPTDAAGMEAAIEETVNDWKAIGEQYKFSAFGAETPAGGAQQTQGGSGKVDPAITAFAAKKVAEFQQQQQKN